MNQCACIKLDINYLLHKVLQVLFVHVLLLSYQAEHQGQWFKMVNIHVPNAWLNNMHFTKKCQDALETYCKPPFTSNSTLCGHTFYQIVQDP